MKGKKVILIFLIISVIFTLTNCKNKSSTAMGLNSPDIINMYADGKQEQITKKGDKYEQTLFDRINVLINIRMPQEFSAMLGIISDDDIKEFKGYEVEFVYNKVQTVTIDNVKEEFTEVVFPLSEKWENTAFIKTNDNSYKGVGLKENLDHLVKAAVKLK